MRGGCPIVTCSRSMATVGKMDAPIPPIATGWPIAFEIWAAIAVRTVSVARIDRAQTAMPMTSRMRTAAAAASAFLTMEASARTAPVRAVLEHCQRVDRRAGTVRYRQRGDRQHELPAVPGGRGFAHRFQICAVDQHDPEHRQRK